jgi:hypothetical protein
MASATQRLLAEAATPAVEALVAETPPPLSNVEFDVLLDELIADAGTSRPALSAEAVSREGLYGDHL